MVALLLCCGVRVMPLNESPSEKEGKLLTLKMLKSTNSPSMKVPPKRKGNSLRHMPVEHLSVSPSMKVPPKRKGNDSFMSAAGHQALPQ